MFTAVAHKELASAEGYFVEHLAQNDYYAAGEIRPGQWIGAGTERLGMSEGQRVTREQFYALCENHHPLTGERLTLRQNETNSRRVFYDFTCSAPKSASVLAVTLDDQRLVEAHEHAARVALRELEAFAATRVRKAGGQRDRTTANLVAAAFVHTSSRSLDPQLHTHFTVFNATFDERERSWKALQAGAMYDAIRYATAVYRNELARRVREIGYRTSPAKHGFEIEGVSDSVLNKFSKRAQEVKKIAGEMDLPRLKRELRGSPALVKTDQGISTHKILETELYLIQTVKAGCDALAPLCPTYQPANWLSEDQQRAVLHVLRTYDRITGIRGLAGTGKTTTLRELIAACQQSRIKPVFCAPTTAATEVLKREGFEPVTLQSLLLSRPVLSKRHLVVLDEAGAVGVDDMKRLFNLAKDCRIILSGDTGQHASVTRGDALRILEHHSRFQSGQLTRIRRQRRAEYRKAVELAAHKHTTEAFAQLNRIGAVVEFAGDELHDYAASSFLKAVEVVAGENDSLKVRRIDGAERDLKLGAGPVCFDVGEKRNVKVASGDRLLLQANWRKKFVNGELVEVKAISGDSIVLADGRVIPADYRTFTHGYAVTSHAAQGKTADEVLVVASSRSLPAINQQQFYVSISRGRDSCRIFADDKDLLRSHVTRSSARIAAVEAVQATSVPQHGFLRRALRWAAHIRKWRYVNNKPAITPDHRHQEHSQFVAHTRSNDAKTNSRISM